jgi:hypothetical protein
MLELAFFQHLALLIHIPRLGRPQHQGANGIGEAAARDRIAFGFQLGRGLIIGSKKDLKRCAVFDLRVELAGRAERQQGFMTGVLLKFGSNFCIGAVKLAATATWTSAAWTDPLETASKHQAGQ